MDCKNKEKFPISTIMFDQTYVKDDDGNILFKLNNYINQKQFCCDVGILDSQKSEIKESSKNAIKIILGIIIPVTVVAVVIAIVVKKFCISEEKTPILLSDQPISDASSVLTITNKKDNESYVQSMSNFSSNNKDHKKNYFLVIKKFFLKLFPCKKFNNI